MKRKIMSVIMAVLMMTMIITPFSVNATRTSIEQVGSPAVKTDVTSDGWNYTLYEDGDVYINGYSGSSTTVTLPDSIEGHIVKGYFEQLLSSTNKYGTTGSKVEKLIIADGTPISVDSNITYTFAWSDSLKEVQIGTKFINKIPAYCFLECPNLSKVTFSDRFKEQAKVKKSTIFRDECFGNCSSLKTFVVPEGVTNISRSAFDKTMIENIVLGNNCDDCCINYSDNIKNVVVFSMTNTVFGNSKRYKPANIYGYPNSIAEEDAKEYSIMNNYQCNFIDLNTVKNIDEIVNAWQNGEEPTVPTTTTSTTTSTTESTTEPSSSISTPDEPVPEPTTSSTESTTTETKPQEVKATGITLNYDKLNLTRYNVDVMRKLTATVSPNEATKKTVNWKSSNTKVATVDKNGYVTAKGKGTVKITATTTDGSNLSATCTVTVKQMVTMIVSTMSINRSSKNVTRKLPVMVGNNASNKKLNYKSNNNKVVSVNSKGQITAKARGTTTITITPNDGSNIVVNYRVTVKQLVTSVKLNKKSVTLKTKGKSKSYKLKATVTKSANNKSLKWTTTNKRIATVNQNGKVTAKKKGTCYIVATAKDGSRKSVKCKVTVK